MRFPVIVALCLLLTAVPATASPILNGSFETGDFTGWNVFIGVGSSVLPEGMTVPAGDATVTPLLQGSFCNCGAEPRPPVDGAYLAAIMVGSFFDPLSPVVDVTISQSLSLTLGDTLSGWSFFYNG